MITTWRFLRAGERRNWLHLAIIIIITLKSAVVLVSAVYWNRFARSGIRQDSLLVTKRIAFAASETGFFGVLLVISKGWRITCFELRSTELKTLLLALGVLFTTLTFFSFSFYSDDYYFLSLMIMYFFMLPKIFSSITKNLRALEAQIWMANNVQLPDTPLTAFQRKLKMFKILRGSVIAYLASILIVNSMRIIVIWYWDWINAVVNEVITFVVVAVIANILRPGDDGVFTDLSEIASLATLQSLVERANSMANVEGPQLIPWDMQATLVIKFPSKEPPPQKDEEEQQDNPAAHLLSLALREDYDKREGFEASLQRPRL
jgi:hypothetical protein